MTGLHRHVVFCRHGGGLSIDIVARAQSHATAAVKLRADILGLRQMTVVIAAPVTFFAVGSGQRIQVEVMAGNDFCLTVLAAVVHLRCGQIDVVHSPQAQRAIVILHIDARRPVKIAIAVVARQRAAAVDVATCYRHQRITALQGAADVVDIGHGFEIDAVSANIAAVVEGVSTDLRHFTAGYFSPVGQVAAGVEHHVGAGQQGPATVEVAFFHSRINLWHQHALPRTVRQGNVLFDQPHHIAGQQRHLLWRQGHARRQVVILSESHARVHQRFVLLAVIAVARQVTLPGQIDDLIADQSLFVVTIAQTLVQTARILAKRTLHVVTA